MSSPDPARWLTDASARIVPMCEECVASTDVDGGGVALLSSAGVRSVFYASNDVSMALEALQIDLAEGPCVDAGTNRSPVLVEDLRDPRDGVAQRWPFFLPGADALGVRGLFAFPLRVGSIVLGTLELHRATAGELRRPQLSFALRSAEEMGSALLELWAAQEIPALGRPAAVVHQAAGMVMVQLDVSIEDAMARLRASAYAEGVSLVDLADDVVRRRRRFTKEQR